MLFSARKNQAGDENKGIRWPRSFSAIPTIKSIVMMMNTVSSNILAQIVNWVLEFLRNADWAMSRDQIAYYTIKSVDQTEAKAQV